VLGEAAPRRPWCLGEAASRWPWRLRRTSLVSRRRWWSIGSGGAGGGPATARLERSGEAYGRRRIGANRQGMRERPPRWSAAGADGGAPQRRGWAAECGAGARRSVCDPLRIGFGREDACGGMGSRCGEVKLISVEPTKLTQIPPLRDGRIFGGVSPN
jgi:hypothetical protein